jgi:ATP-binding cassette subfamily F protein 3
VYEEMTSASSTTMVPMIRTILGGFLFSGDDVYKKCAVLSGGERNRLALAKMLLNASNLLLLDEPTNHLDLDSKEVLLDALADYGGTLIFVSHDRYFVDKLASKVIEIGGGEALLYPGGYEDFVDWKKRREAGLDAPLPTTPARPAEAPPRPARPAAAPMAKGAPAAKPSPAKPAKPVPPPARDPMAPRLRTKDTRPERSHVQREQKRLKARLVELEMRVAEKEAAVKAIEAEMAAPGFYDDRAAADQKVAQHQSLMWEVGDLMGQWEMLAAQVEAAG